MGKKIESCMEIGVIWLLYFWGVDLKVLSMNYFGVRWSKKARSSGTSIP